MGGRFKREVTYIYLWLIHIVSCEKPTQYCKAIILQLKINNFLKKINSPHADSGEKQFSKVSKLFMGRGHRNWQQDRDKRWGNNSKKKKLL